MKTELTLSTATGSGFFAPVDTSLLGALLTTHKRIAASIDAVDAFMQSDDCKSALGYYLKACREDQGRIGLNVSGLMQKDKAMAALHSDYWDKALRLTDVLECMPQVRRDEWCELIKKHETPPFEDEAVYLTLQELLNSREKFLAERVEGIFRALSGEHVTNSPAAFGKRMILYVMTSYGTTNYTNEGHISDLRKIIARFMGRDEPTGFGMTTRVIQAGMAQTGEWLTIDGGAMRIRCYQKGTAHLEIHPEMAWRLNAILAHIYPLAIPPEFRTKPKRKIKDFVLMNNPLPFAVLGMLSCLKAERHTPFRPDRWRDPVDPLTTNPFNRRFGFGEHDKAVRAKAESVLSMIGGVPVKCGKNKNIEVWEFDYDPSRVLGEIVASGCIPDYKSHQYYPTLESMGQVVIETADIGETDKCLEPEAGQGGLADLMPKERTHCVEISKLHCEILKAKGYTVTNGDFLKLAQEPIYDRVAMNPPFDQGRWRAHVEHAAGFVTEGGRLVAILPSGAKNKFDLPGFACEWSQVFDNQFDGTSVSVVILKADRIQ